MFKVLCSNYKGLTYEKKINVNRGGGLVFASSFPMIAASCENKNPTDESIVNNTTPQTQDNHKIKNKKEKQKILMVLVIHLRILPHKLKVIKTQQKHKSNDNVSIKTDPTNSKTVHQQQDNPTRLKVVSYYGMLTPQTKDKEQKENRSGSGNSSTDTAPQTQGNQNQENLRVLIMFL
ncbi:hypothetical protein HYD78_01135 [Mycoplasmopsis bovis]|nr:hypothetical protein [Mycoplasmopsis bovis]QQH43199.1 hypothetical protein HYD78_01135 [Mycoplasmopsis bovis]